MGKINFIFHCSLVKRFNLCVYRTRRIGRGWDPLNVTTYSEILVSKGAVSLGG